MSLAPFRRILRKFHNGAQTVISFHPNNIASLDTLRQQPKDVTFSDTSYQVIPSEDSRTFRRVPHEETNQWCQTIQEETPHACLATATTEEEDIPMYRRHLRKIFDSNFIAAVTKKDRSL